MPRPATAVRSRAQMTTGDQLIAVAGEALVDVVLEPGGTTTRHLGGGSYNTARTIGRLGLAPVFVGRISSDVSGRALRSGLSESGVRLDGVVVTDDPTTFALVQLDGHGAASYRFYADGTSISGLLPEQARTAMPSLPAALHVGGLGLVFEPQARAIAGLVREVPSTTLVMLDPNCRPGAAPYPDVHRERLRELLTRVDVVKASEEDLAYMEPEQPALQTARELLERGPAAVLLTDGSRGATVIAAAGDAGDSRTARQRRRHDRGRRRVRRLVGGRPGSAGGLAADLGDADALARASRFAAQVAARTCEQGRRRAAVCAQARRTSGAWPRPSGVPTKRRERSIRTMLGTLRRAGAVLDLYTTDEPEWGVTATAQRLGIGKSLAHDILSAWPRSGCCSALGTVATALDGARSRWRRSWCARASSRLKRDRCSGSWRSASACRSAGGLGSPTGSSISTAGATDATGAIVRLSRGPRLGSTEAPSQRCCSPDARRTRWSSCGATGWSGPACVGRPARVRPRAGATVRLGARRQRRDRAQLRRRRAVRERGAVAAAISLDLADRLSRMNADAHTRAVVAAASRSPRRCVGESPSGSPASATLLSTWPRTGR